MTTPNHNPYNIPQQYSHDREDDKQRSDDLGGKSRSLLQPQALASMASYNHSFYDDQRQQSHPGFATGAAMHPSGIGFYGNLPPNHPSQHPAALAPQAPVGPSYDMYGVYDGAQQQQHPSMPTEGYHYDSTRNLLPDYFYQQQNHQPLSVYQSDTNFQQQQQMQMLQQQWPQHYPATNALAPEPSASMSLGYVEGGRGGGGWPQPAYPDFEKAAPVTSHTQPVVYPRAESKKKRAPTFPEKLIKAMMEYENENAVAWLPDGKSFVIVNPDKFVKEVLDSVFKKAKYASFVRKLHRWGFVRLTSGTGTDCFHHPLFNKNRPEMASQITCTPPQKEGYGSVNKPPSLAGVERFIRAKAAAAAAKEKEEKAKQQQTSLSSDKGSVARPVAAIPAVTSRTTLAADDESTDQAKSGGDSLFDDDRSAA